MNAVAAQMLLAFIGLCLIGVGFIYNPDDNEIRDKSRQELNRRNLTIARGFWIAGAISVLPCLLTLWNHAIFG